MFGALENIGKLALNTAELALKPVEAAAGIANDVIEEVNETLDDVIEDIRNP